MLSRTIGGDRRASYMSETKARRNRLPLVHPQVKSPVVGPALGSACFEC